MARKYPAIRLETITSSGEGRLFDLLKAELPDRYNALHSVTWVGGEADFLILHPDYGCLVLGVVGGEIIRERHTLAWYSRDKHNELHLIDNPFDEVKSAMVGLQNYLRDARPDLPLAESFKRAVAFPDTALGNRDLGPDAPRWLILDSADLQTLELSLLRAWKPSTNASIGSEGVDAIVQLFSPDGE